LDPTNARSGESSPAVLAFAAAFRQRLHHESAASGRSRRARLPCEAVGAKQGARTAPKKAISYQVDAEPVHESASCVGTALESDANAMARCSPTKPDRDPSGWQRPNTEIRRLADTEFLVVRLHITQSFDSTGRATFTGSYADDVRMTLCSRPSLP